MADGSDSLSMCYMNTLIFPGKRRKEQIYTVKSTNFTNFTAEEFTRKNIQF